MSPLPDAGPNRQSLLTAFIGVAMTICIALVSFHADARQARARDDVARQQTVGTLQLLTSGVDSKVEDLRNLFVASHSVSEREFESFTTPMLQDARNHGFSWLQKVTPDQRAAFARAYGVATATRDSPAADASGRVRLTTFPVRYSATGTPPPGYDGSLEPARRETMLRAVRTGQPQSTPLVDLAGPARAGFIVFAPVYRPGGRHTLADTRGLVSGSFTILEARLAIARVVPAGTSVRVRLDGRDALRIGTVDAGATTSSFMFAGREWSVQSSAEPSAGVLGPAATAGGLLITLLLLLTRSLRSGRALIAGGRIERDRAERRFREVFAAAPIGMALIDASGRVVRVNRALTELLGFPEADLLTSARPRLLPDKDRATFEQLALEAAARPGEVISAELHVLTATGVRSADCHVAYLDDEQLMLVQVVDMTVQRASEEQLVHQAEHDPLTDLFNRRGFSRVLDEHMAASDGGAVVLLDLDHFKAINDLHGHRTGDDVLIHAAQLLAGEFDTVARMGGDEFAILLPNAGPDDAANAAQRLVALIDDTPFPTRGGRHDVTASVGVAMLSATMREPDDALVAADLAMYDAKAAGRSRHAVYDEDAAGSHTRERLETVAQIRSALTENRFFLVAQPIRCLTTGAIVHHELLLRMRLPDGSVLPPAAFLAVAEEFGLIAEVDLWVARNAIAILDLHRDRSLAFHINLSGGSLGDPSLLAKIRAELARTGVDASRLVFEITETAAVGNFDEARAFATALTDIGCKLALDDFGAGFSSFVYLKQLPFDILKIDGEFVRNCTANVADRVILESLVHTASGLRKHTVAEFVEDQATEDLLRDLGVDFVQGYHVGRPIDVHEAVAAHHVAA